MSNNYTKQRFLESAATQLHCITLNCPCCGSFGLISNNNYIFRGKVFNYVGDFTERRIEVTNVDCVCNHCKQPFRISHGGTIKRVKKAFEISSNSANNIVLSLFLFSFILLFLPMIDFNFQYPDEYFIYGFIILFVISIFSSIYFKIFPPYIKFHVEEESKLKSKGLIHLPLLEDIWNLNNSKQDMETTISSMQSVLNQKINEISDLVCVLKLNNRKEIFTSENELQTYLYENINDLTFNGKKLRVFSKNGKIGYEYITDIGRIDLLFLDEDDNFIIIETKLDKTPDKTIGQLLRYVGWISQHLNKNNKQIFGVILGAEIDKKLIYASNNQPNIFLIRYNRGLYFESVNISN
jgi:hypothetical protein